MGSHVADNAVANLQTPHEGASVDLHKAVGTMTRLTCSCVAGQMRPLTAVQVSLQAGRAPYHQHEPVVRPSPDCIPHWNALPQTTCQHYLQQPAAWVPPTGSSIRFYADPRLSVFPLPEASLPRTILLDPGLLITRLLPYI